MSFYKGCPGAINFREMRPEYIDCHFCGTEMEIWSDEPSAKCPECSREVT